MEPHKIAIAICIAAIALFGASVTYSVQHDTLINAQAKVAEQLSAARSQLESAEHRKARTLSRLNGLKHSENNVVAKNLSKHILSLNEEIRSKESLLAEATKELTNIEKQIAVAIAFQRAVAVGSKYPRLELANGKILLNAKLVMFSPQELEFVHSAGKSTVRWNILPKELIYRLHMGEDEEVVDNAIIQDTDETEEQAAAAKAQAEVEAEAKAIEARLRAARYNTAAIAATIQSLQRKAAPNPVELAELRRKHAMWEAYEKELAEKLYNLDVETR